MTDDTVLQEAIDAINKQVGTHILDEPLRDRGQSDLYVMFGRAGHHIFISHKEIGKNVKELMKERLIISLEEVIKLMTETIEALKI